MLRAASVRLRTLRHHRPHVSTVGQCSASIVCRLDAQTESSSSITRPFTSICHPCGTPNHHDTIHHSPSPHYHIQKRSKVFVSKHNSLNLTPTAITTYLTSQYPHLAPQDFRITSSHVVVKECIFCSKPTNGKADNQFKLYISKEGAYFCHRCGAKGSWYDFKSAVGGFTVDSASNRSPNSQIASHGFNVTNGEVNKAWNWSTTNNNGMNYTSTKSTECLPVPPRKLVSLHSTRLFDSISNPSSEEYAAYTYLTQTRGLNSSVLRKYGVGCASYKFPSKESNGYVSNMCVTFPWLMREGEVAEQEELRGAEYVWKSEGEGATDDNVATTAATTRENIKEKKTRRKKLSEMSALDRHLLRQRRKDEARNVDSAEDENTLSKSQVSAMLKGVNLNTSPHPFS